MQRHALSYAIALFIAFLLSCTPKTGRQSANKPGQPAEPAEWSQMGKPLMGDDDAVPVELDEMVVEAQTTVPPDSLPVYRASHPKAFDLLHTRIEISFDWPQKRAKGKANLRLRPWFYATNTLTLEAKNFLIHDVRLAGAAKPLPYDYDNVNLSISLGKTYTRKDEINIEISYTARPDERENFGGSSAIQMDKGLYFINPEGATAGLPQQIWTQGETESNSYWFPTLDKPNQRCSQELIITVEDRFKTLSNGLLVSSRKNKDGTRTDHWKMDKPHAPYLFMMAIGEYAVVREKWKNIDLEYYVEPEYQQDAGAIFSNTPAMLDFFSKRLGYAYPWDKYAQVVVRNYVSGAMENTTAVIFGEFMQASQRDLLDRWRTNESIVAHEMIHHWFGDLVTCESWSNLTLNEGFATYGEYLWFEHQYGRDEADYHAKPSREGYLQTEAHRLHPLIFFGYDNREDMFDAHSYNKGGAILHMLREVIGDDAFFAGIEYYLKKNEYTDVEAHELRLAFEEVTGLDLNWFFNQWFFAAGHPQLEIKYRWDETARKAYVDVAQTQEGKDVPYVFELPLYIDLYAPDGSRRREQVRLTRRTQTFAFDAAQKPALINFDAAKALLCDKKDDHSPEEWAFMYRHAKNYNDRSEALEALAKSSDIGKTVTQLALSDPHFSLRIKAIKRVSTKDVNMLPALEKLAVSDPEPAVRAEALNALAKLKNPAYADLFRSAIEQPDNAYSVVGAALKALAKLDEAAAVEYAVKMEGERSAGLPAVIADLYALDPKPGRLPFFEKNLERVGLMESFGFIESYQKYVVGLNDPQAVDMAAQRLKAMATDMGQSSFKRFASTKGIADMRATLRKKGDTDRAESLGRVIAEIKEKETDQMILMYYNMF
ncbi:MAG: M1 family aminopeptidase [Saprospiraceae bacterium]